ncbi:MAG: hypothetical protein PF487_10540 [Bacteroidales bacterium]|jgi:hypothetical protein|nr:hypothetical protein [Bacteroidales bacterium]
MAKLFHLPNNKKFTFATRYYDEQKEDLEKRIRAAKAESKQMNPEEQNNDYVPNIKGQMNGYFKRSIREKKNSYLRLAIILVVLFTIAYFLLFY